MFRLWILLIFSHVITTRCELLIVDAVGLPIGYWLEVLNFSHPLSGVKFRSDPAMLTPDANQEDVTDAIASAFRTASDPNSAIVCGPATISHARAYASTLKSQHSSVLSMALSTETALLDRMMFPNVQSMIPNMDAEAFALTTLITHFEWHRISFVYAQSVETQSLSISVLSSCSKAGITVYPYTFDNTLIGLQQTMERVKSGGSYIIVLAVTEIDLPRILTECSRIGLSESPWQLVFMTTASRRIDLAYKNPDVSELLDGVLAIQTWIDNSTIQQEARNLWSQWHATVVDSRSFIPPADVMPPAVMGVFYALYRTIWLLAEAALDANNSTAPFLRNYLYTHTINSAVGSLSFNPSTGAMNPLFTATRLGKNIMDIRPIATFSADGIRLLDTMIWRGSQQTIIVPNDRYQIRIGSDLSWSFSVEDIVLSVTLACACGFVCTIMFESMLQSRDDGRKWILWLLAITLLQSCCTWSVSVLAFISMQPKGIGTLFRTAPSISSFLISPIPWGISLWILMSSRKQKYWIVWMLMVSASICVLIAHFLTFGTLFWSKTLILSAPAGINEQSSASDIFESNQGSVIIEHNSGDWVLGALMGILCISCGFWILMFFTKNWLRYILWILLPAGVVWMIFAPLSGVHFLYNGVVSNKENTTENTSLRYICLASSLCILLVCLFLTAVIRGSSVVGLVLKARRIEEQYTRTQYKLAASIEDANNRYTSTVHALYSLAALQFPGEDDPLLKEPITYNQLKTSPVRSTALEIVNDASHDPIGIAMILSICSRGMRQEAPSFLLYLQALRTKPMISSPHELGEYILHRFLSKNSSSVLNLSETVRFQAETKLSEILKSSFPTALDIDLVLREIEYEALRLVATNLTEHECELLRKWSLISKQLASKILKEPHIPETPRDFVPGVSRHSSSTSHNAEISISSSPPKIRAQNYITN